MNTDLHAPMIHNFNYSNKVAISAGRSQCYAITSSYNIFFLYIEVDDSET